METETIRQHMSDREHVKRSKFLSLILRHQPELVGITLDAQGWVDVDVLLAACGARGRRYTRAELDEIVATSPKQRYAFSSDGKRIRASQGHSVSIDLGYAPATPPALLFHGTVASVLPAIRRGGLLKMSRHHVHLSEDLATATNVGSRRGAPIILRIDAAAMHAAGHVFYRSANGVWLTDHVPPEFIAP